MFINEWFLQGDNVVTLSYSQCVVERWVEPEAFFHDLVKEWQSIEFI